MTDPSGTTVPSPVTYRLDDRVATITMDDGKANVLSLAMQATLHAAFDRATEDRAVVVLSGRPGVFSGGFDLATVRAGGPDMVAMIRGGFELSARLLAHPYPVVMACTGHAVAMGAFLLLSGDYSVGAAGDYKLVTNEVAIGMTMPYTAIEISRQRLSPAAFNRALLLAETFHPHNGVEAGFLDHVVPTDQVHDTAHRLAESLAALDLNAHAATKLRARANALQAISDAIATDAAAMERILG